MSMKQYLMYSLGERLALQPSPVVILLFLYYLFGKGCYVFGSVGLFLCLSVCKHLDWNFMQGSGKVKVKTH